MLLEEKAGDPDGNEKLPNTCSSRGRRLPECLGAGRSGVMLQALLLPPCCHNRSAGSCSVTGGDVRKPGALDKGKAVQARPGQAAHLECSGR